MPILLFYLHETTKFRISGHTVGVAANTRKQISGHLVVTHPGSEVTHFCLAGSLFWGGHTVQPQKQFNLFWSVVRSWDYSRLLSDA